MYLRIENLKKIFEENRGIITALAITFITFSLNIFVAKVLKK